MIVHYFIISGKNFERVNIIGKFLKTFNKNIKIHFAVCEGEDVNGVLDLNAVDSVITVTDDEMNKAKNSLDKAEHLHISDSDSAALYAGAKIAKTAKNNNTICPKSGIFPLLADLMRFPLSKSAYFFYIIQCFALKKKA